MTPPVIPDLDALLAPLPGGDPAGEPVSYVLREKLDTARKSINPNDYAANDPLRPAEPKFADWPEIVAVTTAALAGQSKDLMTAARLVEATTKLHGFVGLRDGLTLLRRLADEAWDRVHPVIEDGDIEVRAAAFNWLDDPDRGARFPATVRAVPLISDAAGDMTWHDWKEAQSPPPPDQFGNPGPPSPFPDRFDKAVAATPRAAIQDLVDTIGAAKDELEKLAATLDTKMVDDAPGLSELKRAIADGQDLARRMLDKKGPAPVEVLAEPEPLADGETSQPAAAANGRAGRPLTRDDAYRQLAEAAVLLQRLEPHSPIPFMIQRAVALGRLPFPELMKVMIRDPGVVAQLARELGLEPAEPGL